MTSLVAETTRGIGALNILLPERDHASAPLSIARDQQSPIRVMAIPSGPQAKSQT